MAPRPPWITSLSQAFVAFTIEFDNEAEHQLPHTTTDYGRTPGAVHTPWLASMAMWFNCLQYVGEQGIALHEMRRRARTETNLDGMQRWGYVYLTPDPADQRRKPPKADWLVRSTPAGRLAQKIWQPLLPVIEARWQERFGASQIQGLRGSLVALVRQLDPALPDCLPIGGYGLFSSDPRPKPLRKAARKSPPPAPGENLDVAALPLPVLMARVLHACAVEFEQESSVSLALSANILRVLDERPTRLRDLPELTGISTALTAVGTGWLARHGFAVLDTAPAPDRGRQIRLSEKGLVAQESYITRLRELDRSWRQRFGAKTIGALSTVLAPIVRDGTPEKSPLFRGLVPYPEGWRAQVRPPATLPHYPLVTHRGGYPDGS
ncbi:MAG TPA: hypothetical protein VHX60_06745 [Acidobacteriaceae bacterium]|jgi:DNA-binding MarR family transcriptional regulator|nr:hypothetical protein [Acidobacteriaceae bacterium]